MSQHKMHCVLNASAVFVLSISILGTKELNINGKRTELYGQNFISATRIRFSTGTGCESEACFKGTKLLNSVSQICIEFHSQ